MGKRLDSLLEGGLVIRKGTWYYIVDGDKKLGQNPDKAEAALDELGYIKPSGTVDTETSVTTKEQPDQLKTLESIPKNEEDPNEFYESLVGDLQDIKSFRREGVYNVYVFGVDVRLEKDPVIRACPFVFSWRKVTGNVKSGNVIINEGWTVLSRTKIVDKRTGKPFISTNRDDSPDADYIQVGTNVLCYASKTAWMKMQAEEIAKNITRTSEVADSREEYARNMAAKSKSDIVGSMAGFNSANVSEQAKAVEFVSQGSEAKKTEVESIMSDLNKMGAGDVEETADQIEQRLTNLRHSVESGQTSKSVVGSQKIAL